MILTEEEIKEIQEKPFSQNDWLWFYTRAIEQAILDKLQDKLKNAERYEWLRNKVAVSSDSISGAYCWMPSCNYKLNTNDKSETDKAIDSAIEKERTNVQN